MLLRRSKSAEILPIDSATVFRAALEKAAGLLRAGEVVAIPTETVYGLAANALNAAAVGRIFEVKGRPPENPIIVHVASLAMARDCVADWPAVADKLAKSFWPGPLTLVLPRAPIVPDAVTAGGTTVGVRWPSHPFVQALIHECGFPLAAPSANLSSRVSPTTAGHVQRQLGRRIPLIIDGGPSQIGIESTVLDLSVEPPRLLRPGMIHEGALLAVIEQFATGATESGAILKSPGMLKKHYAPRARLALWSWQDDRRLRELISACGVPSSRVFIIAHTRIPSGKDLGRVSVIPHDPEAFARAIYAELHECDDAGAELVVVEALPRGVEWKAITDRLNRAAQT